MWQSALHAVNAVSVQSVPDVTLSPQAFLHSGPGGFAPVSGLPIPPLPLDAQCKIRDRCSIMARHMYADRGDAFADQQVSRLLHAMGIDAAALPAKLEAQWGALYQQHADANARLEGAMGQLTIGDGWAGEFAQRSDGWAGEFARQARVDLSMRCQWSSWCFFVQ